MRSKYYVRVMRPSFQWAVLTVRAHSEEAAALSALNEAGDLSEAEWTQLGTERESPLIEMVYSKEDADGDSEAQILEYVCGERHAYALLQADLEAAEGSFIAPMWLKEVPELAAADITSDWSEDLSGVCGEETQAFYAWLKRQGRPSNVVDFFAERDKRRGALSDDADADD
ncbi:MAG TPA: hypothetical protein VJ738_19375 [Steroidobacteraceae bacterium]|nr:hypothetical protein [Steroidobacteraceae bacterium]